MKTQNIDIPKETIASFSKLPKRESDRIPPRDRHTQELAFNATIVEHS